MKIRYFSDTDTALIEFSGGEVVRTEEISENLYYMFIRISDPKPNQPER